MSMSEKNGSAIIAMAGKNCFAIASDCRVDIEQQTVADSQSIFKIRDNLFLGLSGLSTDAKTLYEKLFRRNDLHQFEEARDIKPAALANLVTVHLREKRFDPYLIQPVIAGLGDNDEPFICGINSTGAEQIAENYVVAGTASASLRGAIEAKFRPDMEPDELYETIEALISSVDHGDAGDWGVQIYVGTPTEVMEMFFSEGMD